MTSESSIRILSASTDSHLNRSRAALLRHQGFETLTTESEETAIALIKTTPFHILIFGSTLATDTCWRLAAIYREHNPKGKIIEILPLAFMTPKNRPDATVWRCLGLDGGSFARSTF